MSEKSALVLVADGSEEMETVIAVDCLRRAEVKVTLASSMASRKVVCCSRGVLIQADALLSELAGQDYDCLVLPGGIQGAKAFQKDPLVQDLLERFIQDEAKIVGIICASPIALLPRKLASGRAMTCYPTLEGEFDQDYKFEASRVVRDGNLVTSMAPGTAMEFSL
ncbi:MAG: hypothetical protein SGCHY_005619, partial [Lobulomycetales sp.]